MDQNNLHNNTHASHELLPKYFRTSANKKFLTSTLDQLTQPGVIEKVNGFIGQKHVKSYNYDDYYLQDVSQERENYQLEPACVIQDNLNNVTFYKDYNDYINYLKSQNVNIKNHNTVTQQEIYAWDPRIDFDKFVNFREYYWVPEGQLPINLSKLKATESSITVTRNKDGFIFENESKPNPPLTLYRGVTYNFIVKTNNKSFSIRESNNVILYWSSNTYYKKDDVIIIDNQLYKCNVDHFSGIKRIEDYWDIETKYEDYVSKHSVYNDTITVKLDTNTPNILFYISDDDETFQGVITVKDSTSTIDVESDIVGKKNVTFNNISLSNGMIIEFDHTVKPEKYQNKKYYVEGVGHKISLHDTENYSDKFISKDDPDYITIKRSSQDGNPWSRTNSWVHKDVIRKSYIINNKIPIYDHDKKAKRPIIEFDANLRLFNYGTLSFTSVDLIDDYTKDIKSSVENTKGYNIDDVEIQEGMTILFTNESRLKLRKTIFKVKKVKVNNQDINTLVEIPNSDIKTDHTVYCKQGKKYKGTVVWLSENEWKIGQQKTQNNQEPLFDIFDEQGDSLSNLTKYPYNNFNGTPFFSYKKTDDVDNILNFGVSYHSIRNIGDLEFIDYYNHQNFSYKIRENDVIENNINIGYLRKYNSRTDFEILSDYTSECKQQKQPIIKQYNASSDTTRYKIDVFDRYVNASELNTKAFINGDYLDNSNYNIVNENDQLYILFDNHLNDNDQIILKIESDYQCNENGFYEIPTNLENNPNNDLIKQLTYSEIANHLYTITQNVPGFRGNHYGINNLRDLPYNKNYGTKIIKNSIPLNFVIYHSLSKNVNIIKSIEYSRKEYGKFKRDFIRYASEMQYDGTIKEQVDHILITLNNGKNRSSPFYFTDMVPYTAPTINTFTVRNKNQQYFSLSSEFSMKVLSNKAVNVYQNDIQLIHGKDYEINDSNFVKISCDRKKDDIIKIYEYSNTNGSFIPSTPSKLGLFPKYIPEIRKDDTYLTTQNVLIGHDGSKSICYDDYRDELLLELEKRIFNNIKIEYDDKLFNIHDFIPGINRNVGILEKDLLQTLLPDFRQWLSLVDDDYATNNSYSENLPFTYNYSTVINGEKITGTWKRLYQYAYDTTNPHTHPWEMLGFSIKPEWWEEQYGEPPYTSNNLLLWNDIKYGIIRDPVHGQRVNDNYKRPSILKHIPVDKNGDLLDPINSNFIKEYQYDQFFKPFQFGDSSPVEMAWKNNSEYRFSLLKGFLLNFPSKVLSTGYDRSRQYRNKLGMLCYNNNVLSPSSIITPNSPNNNYSIYASGLVNYIRDVNTSESNINWNQYKNDLLLLKSRLGIKLGGYTSKDKFQVSFDSKKPSSTSSSIIPKENYHIFLNRSTPIYTYSYSGIIIERTKKGYIIRGYDVQNPSIEYNPPIPKSNDVTINVGGISSEFIEWEPFKTYSAGMIVRYQDKYYRVKHFHSSDEKFSDSNYASLPFLPIQGGKNVLIRKSFKDTVEKLPYGTVIPSSQEVVDVILGYEHLLFIRGLKFENKEKSGQPIQNWRLGINQFLAWTLTNWGERSAIAISPGAEKIDISSENCILDNIYDSFEGYTIFGANGNKLPAEYITVDRSDPKNVTIKSNSPTDGIYGTRLEFVQTEHVILFDNETIFGDIIYRQVTGYRQPRLKISGYRTANWDGSLNIPGFIYDQAKITNWMPWTDYQIGETVKYKQFYYTSLVNITGSETFNKSEWTRLYKRPESDLLPNLQYKTNQFEDFYSLDTDNFDIEQQKFAQHLIGYQKREYLSNIIEDDISQYKLYQGFIQDKGTYNSLLKIFDSISDNDENKVEINEEWAVKVGSFGSTGNLREIEYQLNSAITEPQCIELVNESSEKTSKLIQYFTPRDVLMSNKNLEDSVLPITNDNSFFIPNVGYVNSKDVNFIIDEYSEILNIPIKECPLGHYIWITSNDIEWDVVHHTRTDTKIFELLENRSGFSIVTLSGSQVYTAGEIIGISNTLDADGFYTISQVTENSIIINLGSDKDIQNGNISKLVSKRMKDIKDANVHLLNYNENLDKLWIDNKFHNWKVIQKNESYEPYQKFHNGQIYSATRPVNVSIITDNSDNSIIIGRPEDNKGKVFIYKRTSHNEGHDLFQIIQPKTEDLYYGSVVEGSKNNNYLFIANQYATVDNKERAGYVDIYQRQSNNKFKHVNTLYSPIPEVDDEFGSSIKIHELNNVITVFIMSRRPNGGGIHIFKKGIINGISYDWDSNSDKRYVGEYKPNTSYNKNDIILNQDILYIANLDVSQYTSFELGSWEEIPYTVELSDGIKTENHFSYIGDLHYQLHDLVISDDKKVIASYHSSKSLNGVVIVYQNISGYYTPVQKITGDNVNYGHSLSHYHNRLIISSPYEQRASDEIFIYEYDNEYQLKQTLPTPSWCTKGFYGSKVFHYQNILAVLSDFGKNDEKIVFDNHKTQFDKGFLSFIDKDPYTGSANIYQLIDDEFIYCDSISYKRKFQIDFGHIGIINNHHIVVGSVDETKNNCQMQLYKVNQLPWTKKRHSKPRVDLSKIKSISLYDSVTNKIKSNIDPLDIFQGKIPEPANNNISFKTHYDPAIYTIGDQGNIDPINCWLDENVGKLWWDLSYAKYYNPYQDNVIFSANTWNQSLHGNSIRIYEWVESTLLPDEWDHKSNTTSGRSKGISGNTLYGNSRYSVRKKYDHLSKTFTTYYYYWVRNKQSASNQSKLSAYNVSSIINDPAASGYKFISLISGTQLALHNCSDLLDSNTILKIQYWSDIDKAHAKIHNEYKLLIENNNSTIINTGIEEKWFDSLVGFDKMNREVPDSTIKTNIKYGNMNNPRQSWFINRVEAVKQVIERANYILKNNQIRDNKNISRLFEKELAPDKDLNLYDTVVDTLYDIRYVNTAKIKPAKIKLNTENGEIRSVNILKKGSGYIVPPSIIIRGLGTGGQLITEINSKGELEKVTISSPGQNYSHDDQVIVRNFSVLVLSDETKDNKWSLYERDYSNTVWNIRQVQSYNVEEYWDYVDWYAQGYDSNTSIDYQLNESYELFTENFDDGSIIKIKNQGTGGWLLMKKIGSSDNTNYQTIGREKGTIQLLRKLHDPMEFKVRYDSINYDSVPYDAWPYKELRIILEILRDDLFINDLSIEYNKLLFLCIRYVLSEQTYVDWLFKTSFIKVKHNVGKLHQQVTYKNDNLDNYEEYIKEIKPYKTKIREFISSYNYTDPASITADDYDLPPAYSSDYDRILPQTVRTNQNRTLSTNHVYDKNSNVFWTDNLGYTIEKINIVDDNNIQFNTLPEIKIIGPCKSPASAVAEIDDTGTLINIIMTGHGSGYFKKPDIQILHENEIKNIKVAITLGETKIRTFNSKIKLDRVGISPQISDQSVSETIIAEANTHNILLSWPLMYHTNNVKLFIDDQEILHSFTFENIKDTTKSYKRYIGRIKTEFEIKKNSKVDVKYIKNISLLTFSNRTSEYYKPTPGQYANNLVNLTVGYDYGGTVVNGGEFNKDNTWSLTPWMSHKWNSRSSDVLVDSFIYDGNDSFKLQTNISTTQHRNLYINGLRADDENYGTANQKNTNAIIKSITSNDSIYDDTNLTVDLSSINSHFSNGDNILFVDSSTDASDMSDLKSYDSVIIGGDLSYSSARGIKAEDITFDGGGFLDPVYMAGPEELVTGTVMDTLDIKIYHKDPGCTTNCEVTHSWRQFKDILNRTHYKMITDKIEITSDIYTDSTSITVSDGSLLKTPSTNNPGVIFINGERIEYYKKDGNVLHTIIRGTFGTSVSQTIPSGTWAFPQDDRHDIEHHDTTERADFIYDTQYQFKTPFFMENNDQVEVFVGGVRISKIDLTKHDNNIALDSPEGDVQIPQAFTVLPHPGFDTRKYDEKSYDKSTYDQGSLVIINPDVITLKPGEQITVIKRKGQMWTLPT